MRLLPGMGEADRSELRPQATDPGGRRYRAGEASAGCAGRSGLLPHGPHPRLCRRRACAPADIKRLVKRGSRAIRGLAVPGMPAGSPGMDRSAESRVGKEGGESVDMGSARIIKKKKKN